MEPFIPNMTMRNNFLTNRTERMIYILADFLNVPKSVDELYPEYMFSAVELVAKYKADPEELCSRIRVELSERFKRHFPTDTIELLVSPSHNEDTISYDIHLNISGMDENEIPFDYNQVWIITKDNRLQLKTK